MAHDWRCSQDGKLQKRFSLSGNHVTLFVVEGEWAAGVMAAG